MLELNFNDPEKLVTVAHALSTRSRVDILRLLDSKNLNIMEIAEELKLPVSTVASNVKVLEAAELIQTQFGDHEQNIVMQVKYTLDQEARSAPFTVQIQARRWRWKMHRLLGRRNRRMLYMEQAQHSGNGLARCKDIVLAPGCFAVVQGRLPCT